jgi:hypothetical protein
VSMLSKSVERNPESAQAGSPAWPAGTAQEFKARAAERQHVHREWRISAASDDVLRQGLITGGVAAGPRNANVYFGGVLRILEVAPLRYSDRLWRGPFIGIDRKYPTDRSSGAFDPERRFCAR